MPQQPLPPQFTPNRFVTVDGKPTPEFSLADLFNSIPGEKVNDFYGKALTDIIPDVFHNAQNAKVNYTQLPLYVAGRYTPSDNTINVVKQGQIDMYKRELGITSNQSGLNKILDWYAAAKKSVLPHEAAHAAWEGDLDNRTDMPGVGMNKLLDSPVQFDKNRAKDKWIDLHNANLRDNPALGNYQYANDPSHSFADAYELFASNPERLRNHFPDIYNYFMMLTGFEYKRPKK